jgi:hypothetical protein
MVGGTGCSQSAPPAVADPDQPFSVSVQLSTNAIHVGDTVTATIDVTHPADSEVTLPVLSRDKELVVRDHFTQRTDLEDGRAHTREQWILTSFRTGTHVLSTGQVVCIDAEGNEQTKPFPKAEFTAETMLNEKIKNLRDIAGPVDWPARFPGWILGLLVVIILATVIALLIYRLLNKPRTILQQAPPVPADVIARRALKALQRKGLIEQEQAEPFYVELSDIVRQYLENRFELRAPEQTTEEFIRDVSHAKTLTHEQQRRVCDFLEQSDLVKFARHQPDQTTMQQAFDSADRLVEETKPRPADEEVAS